MQSHSAGPATTLPFLALLAGIFSPSSLTHAQHSLYPDGRAVILSDTGIVAADFDADGHVDVAAGSDAILVGSGDGTLRVGPRIRPMLASRWGQIAVGDFNHDGLLDLVGNGRYNPRGPLIALGNGDGTFGEAYEAYYDRYYNGYSVAVADFNGDGVQDLAYSSYSDGSVAVQIGRGDGTFEPPQIRVLDSYPYPTSVAATDVDRDGIHDLVVLRYWAHESDSQDVLVLLEWEAGEFGRALRFPIAPNCYAWGLTMADFDRDTMPDLAVGCGRGARVHVRLGNGDGTFRTGPDLDGGPGSPRRLKTGDLNHDGNVDLIVSGGSLLVYLGTGDGGFLGPTFTLSSVHGAVPADFDEDGHPDLAVDRGNFVEVLRGDGTGAFRPLAEQHRRFPVGRFPTDIATRDLDGDGVLDLVTANRDSSDVSVLQGAGDGTFLPASRQDVGDGPAHLLLADFDGDGAVDLATANQGSGDVSIVLGVGGGSFGPTISLFRPAPGGLAAAEGDGDGRDNLALRSEERIAVFELEAGRFVLRQDLPTAATLPYEPTFGVAVADMDGDGRSDLVTGAAESDELWVHASNGEGGFDAPVVSAMSSTLWGPRLTAGDFDGDGAADIVLRGWGTYGADFLLCPGGGGGTVRPCSREWRLAFPSVAADLDGNGALDLAGIHDASLAILLNHGLDGGFLPSLPDQAVLFRAGDAPAAVAAGDFDGDGRLDLAVANSGSDDVSVFLNTGVVPDFPPIPRFAASVEVHCAAGTGTVVLDGSGSIDGNSSPGTHDDIALFEWKLEDRPIGSGEVLTAEVPLGSHTVTLTVTDRTGLSAKISQEIEVLDHTPPLLRFDTAPAFLWPPNHRMVEIATGASAWDACSGAVPAILDSVVSDEPDDAPGGSDGNTFDDIQGVEPGTEDVAFALRAERDAQGDGRTYIVTYRATDDEGNTVVDDIELVVPHDVGGSTEPLLLAVGESHEGTVLSWGDVPGVSGYDVIRGDLESLTDRNRSYHLGPVTCVASSLMETTTAVRDPETPGVGDGFFYVAAYDGGTWSGYGTESAAKERFVAPGQGCP